MTDWAEVGRKLRPVIQYRTETKGVEKLDAYANLFEHAGLNETGRKLHQARADLDHNLPSLLHHMGALAVEEAVKQERGMVGHGRSGYVPTGNLMRSIDQHDDDGVTQVYPDATASDGETEYGGFVETGTRWHPEATPYMAQANAALQKRTQEELDDLAKFVFGGE